LRGRLCRAPDQEHQPIRRRTRFAGGCGFLWASAGDSGLLLGVGSLGQLGLVGGLHLRGMRRATAGAVQCSGQGWGEEPFRRAPHSRRGGNDRFDRAAVLLFGWRRRAEQAHHLAPGDLRLGVVDGQWLSLFQSEEHRSAQALSDLDVCFGDFFDYTVCGSAAAHVFCLVPVIYLIRPSLMVLYDQAPTGEERGDGWRATVARSRIVTNDTPVGPAAGVFISGRGCRIEWRSSMSKQGTDQNVVQIFDTTLRDGEQSPGASMTVEQKVVIARQLEKLGVDVIEAGFAASSEGDFESVARVTKEVKHPMVVSLARAQEGDIKKALKAVEQAKRPGIHIFIATSDIHMKHKLRMSRNEVLDAAAWAVNYAKKHIDYIEFSAEDASRSDRDFLVQVFSEVVRAGAKTVNVPDTTGYAIPSEFGSLVRYLVEKTEGSDRVTWSAHCHNDLGLAVANSLAAVANGARQVECTINGIGERAGNNSLEEVVMALKTRTDLSLFPVGFSSHRYSHSDQ